MRTLITILALTFSINSFASSAKTCQNYSTSAWGFSELNYEQVTNLQNEEMGFHCEILTGGQAYKKARVAFSQLPCQPESSDKIKELIDLNAEYRFCVGSYNYYNWYEKTTYYFMNLDDENKNFAFGKAWEE